MTSPRVTNVDKKGSITGDVNRNTVFGGAKMNPLSRHIDL